MSKFIMMVGLPASGKTTLAKQLAKIENAVVLSSDDLRVEMYGDINHQDNNNELFDEMNKRANDLLSKGQNVIYDATNLNRKRRKHLINHLIKADEKIVYYLNNSLATIMYRNSMRKERIIPNEVIERMYKTLQIPVKNEGWNEVIFTGVEDDYYLKKYRSQLETLIMKAPDHDKLFKELAVFIRDFDDVYNLPQDSSYHSFSVSRHIYHVYKYIFDNYKNKAINFDDFLTMLWAALFHDLGKSFCKSFVNYKGEETRYANFIGHEFVSSQQAAWWLTALGYDDQFVKDVSTLVQFHMTPMKASEKKLQETKNLIGDDLFEKLMFLREADMQAK
jgi:predicted kinase